MVQFVFSNVAFPGSAHGINEHNPGTQVGILYQNILHKCTIMQKHLQCKWRV